jgi:CBS domain-containing protein
MPFRIQLNDLEWRQNMLVRDVMTPQLVTISSSATLRECARRMDHLNVGALPVTDQERMVGFITDRDICCRAVGMGRDPEGTRVADIMTGFVNFCFEDQSCSEVVDLMKAQHLRRLPVMNRGHHMTGIISVDDIARYSHQMAGKVLDRSPELWQE